MIGSDTNKFLSEIESDISIIVNEDFHRCA